MYSRLAFTRLNAVARSETRRLSVGSSLNKSTKLGQTSVFFQTGLKICELPLVVQKVNDVLKIGEQNAPLKVKRNQNEPPVGPFTLTYPEDMNPETAEILAGFNRCFTSGGIFRLLETIPAEEVTPPVAVHALNRIISLETSAKEQSTLLAGQDKNLSNLSPSLAATGRMLNQNEMKPSETFLRFAFVNMLLDIILNSKDPKILMEGLQVLCLDNIPLSTESAKTYKEKFYEEVLILVTRGEFGLMQICDTITILSHLYSSDKKQSEEMVDKLWSGIMDKSKEITVDNIATVFSTLPHLRQSRDVILKLLESKVGDFWRHFSTPDVLQILKSMTVIKFGSKKVLQVISQWLSVHIHNLKEEELLAIVCCYSQLEYVDSTIIATLEKYMKVRGCNIKEKDLVAAICDYCREFRIRSTPILEGAGEYFIEHGTSLTTPQIYSISRLYGEFDFHPPNGFKFWQILEHVLEHKFVEFPPKEIIDLLMSFVYIERYPLNFVRKLFNPYFMERLHSQKEVDVVHSRDQLKMFDVAMKQECPQYTGPFLPKDQSNRSLLSDNRIHRLATQLIDPLSEIVGDVKRIGQSVVLSSLPLNPLYVVDLMIYSSVAASVLSFGFRSSNNSQNVAILLHPPEHYDSSGKHLVGRQAMRKRHLTKMGFKVVEFRLEELTKLRVAPNQLHQVLLRELNKAHKSTT